MPVFKRDASQASTLKAIGADRAWTLVGTVNNEITIKKICIVTNDKLEHLELILW